MSGDLVKSFSSIRIDASKWSFSDLRIDIPPLSFGSDAANPHTQYSNAVAVFNDSYIDGVGATFTLGEGNDMICKAAQFLISELDGTSIDQFLDSSVGFYDLILNPRQLRWLSPYAGIPMMAAGLIVNTLIDFASKRMGMPAWEYLARFPTFDLLKLLPIRHVDPVVSTSDVHELLDQSWHNVSERCDYLKKTGLPVYFTTWIGHSAQDVAKQILHQAGTRGISNFKLKIGPNITKDLEKIDSIRKLIPSDFGIAVDANQTLSFEQATTWLHSLSERSVLWLEEPFAPDNSVLFEALANYRRSKNLSCEIASGENCPNSHTAVALIEKGLDRYQPDPCRMLGLFDGLVTAISCKKFDKSLTPHAGGTGLDELSPHLQLLNLARVDHLRNPLATLTENVGFCSHFYRHPTLVSEGTARTPTAPGFLVGLAANVQTSLRDFREGITWLEL